MTVDEFETKRWRVNVREFTDRDGEGVGAHIVARVEDKSAVFGDGWDSLLGEAPDSDCFLKIADCWRAISYSCPMRTAEQRANTLHQIETLTETLVAFRDALRAEVELLDGLPEREVDRHDPTGVYR